MDCTDISEVYFAFIIPVVEIQSSSNVCAFTSESPWQTAFQETDGQKIKVKHEIKFWKHQLID